MVVKKVTKYLKIKCPTSNSGRMGQILPNSSTIFYNIAFPHGNNILDSLKVNEYKKVKALIGNKVDKID